MENYYHIAGIDICVTGKDEEMFVNEGKLKAFRTKKTESYHKYCFSIVDSLEKTDGDCIYSDGSKKIFQNQDKQIRYLGLVNNDIEEAYIRCESAQNQTNVQVKRKSLTEGITSKIVLRALGIETIVLNNGGVVLHASYINHKGKAILFTAPSGTGKSTQAELWKEYKKAEIINGDRVVVQVKDSNIYACGIPFSGSSEYCKNAILPIEAIVYLEQACETTISSLKGIQAFRKLWEQITIPVWEKDGIDKISRILTRVVENIPIYHLASTPDESAILALEAELNKLEKNDQKPNIERK